MQLTGHKVTPERADNMAQQLIDGHRADYYIYCTRLQPAEWGGSKAPELLIIGATAGACDHASQALTVEPDRAIVPRKRSRYGQFQCGWTDRQGMR